MLTNQFFLKDGRIVQPDDAVYGQGDQPDPVIPEPPTVTIGGKTYRVTTIGNQTWLAENLALTWDGLVIDPVDTYGGYINKDQEYLQTVTTASYFNCDPSDTLFGVYYSGNAIDYLQEHKDELIPGWHVPTYDDWEELLAEVGPFNMAARHLKATTMWPITENEYGVWGIGDGSTDFNIYPHGWKTTSGVQENTIIESQQPPHAWFWTSSCAVEEGPGRFFTRRCYAFFTGTSPERNALPGFYQLPIRLIKD